MNCENIKVVNCDPSWAQAKGYWPVDVGEDPTLKKSFDVLRKKWGEVPFDQFERRMSEDLLRLSDDELLEKWEFAYRGSSTGEAFSARGWYQTLYRDVFRGKKVLDVGCGLAPDTIHYAQNGAIVTFLDIIESNVRFASRVCEQKGISNASFCYMEDLNSLNVLPTDFDAIYCCGSLINAPLDVDVSPVFRPNRSTI